MMSAERTGHEEAPRVSSLTVCVEAYNEVTTLKAAVEDLLTTLRPLVKELDIVVVDDGSDDGTYEEAERLAEEHAEVRALHHATNRGIGAAFHTGLAAARAEYYTDFPGDHENPADEVKALIVHAAPGRIVTLDYQKNDSRPWLRRFLSHSYVALVNLMMGVHVRNFNGLSVFPTEALRKEELQAEGFVYSSEALFLLLRRGLTQVDVEAKARGRSSGGSKALRPRAIMAVLRELFRLFWQERIAGRGRRQPHA